MVYLFDWLFDAVLMGKNDDQPEDLWEITFFQTKPYGKIS